MGVALGVEKLREAVGIAIGTVAVEDTDSDIATTIGAEAVSVGTMVERGNVMLGTTDVGIAVLVSDTEETDSDLTESGISGDAGMSGAKSNDTIAPPVKLPTTQSRPRLYPFRIISCPFSIGSSTDALPGIWLIKLRVGYGKLNSRHEHGTT